MVILPFSTNYSAMYLVTASFNFVTKNIFGDNLNIGTNIYKIYTFDAIWRDSNSQFWFFFSFFNKKKHSSFIIDLFYGDNCINCSINSAIFAKYVMVFNV